jgi:hypothetical protein
MKYHVNSTKDFDKSCAKGLKKALDVASVSQNKEVLIKTNQLGNMSGIVESFFGKDTFKKLMNKREVKINYNNEIIMIYLETDKSKASNFNQGIILAPWVTKKVLSNILMNIKNNDLIYLPWLPSELDEYKKANPDSVSL